jgi:hypothetical protein
LGTIVLISECVVCGFGPLGSKLWTVKIKHHHEQKQ